MEKAKLEGMDDAKWAKQVLTWLPVGFRLRGGPHKRWRAPGDKENSVFAFFCYRLSLLSSHVMFLADSFFGNSY